MAAAYVEHGSGGGAREVVGESSRGACALTTCAEVGVRIHNRYVRVTVTYIVDARQLVLEEILCDTTIRHDIEARYVQYYGFFLARPTQRPAVVHVRSETGSRAGARGLVEPTR